jgi:hypothetical protein
VKKILLVLATIVALAIPSSALAVPQGSCNPATPGTPTYAYALHIGMSGLSMHATALCNEPPWPQYVSVNIALQGKACSTCTYEYVYSFSTGGIVKDFHTFYGGITGGTANEYVDSAIWSCTPFVPPIGGTGKFYTYRLEMTSQNALTKYSTYFYSPIGSVC